MLVSRLYNILKSMAPMYYAVAKGRKPGIYNTWDECKLQVNQFSGPVFKKFSTRAEAENFITKNNSLSQKTNNKTLPFVVGKRSLAQRDSSSENKFEKPPLKKQKRAIVKELKKTICLETDNISADYIIDENGYVNVFTDGACSSNGGKNAKAGIGVWFGDGHPLNVSEAVIGRATNNMAEIQAVTVAAKQAKKVGIKNLKVNTDSKFLISCITKWMPKWKANGWKTTSGKAVINKTELLEMEDAIKSVNIAWNHVNGHVGIHGNEMADKLAREGSLKY